MTKYVASVYGGYTYRLNNKGLVNRIYYHPPSGGKAKFPNKILEIVPWFTAGQYGAEEAIGVYTPHEVDLKLFDGKLYLFKTKWVDADSLKITQKKMAIPKNRTPTVYSDDWKKYVPYRGDARGWMPDDLFFKDDVNINRLNNPVETAHNRAMRGKRSQRPAFYVE